MGQGLGRYNAYGMSGYHASKSGQGKGLDVREIDNYYAQYMTLYRNVGAGNNHHLLTGGNNSTGGRNFGVQNNNNNNNNSSAGVNGGDGATGSTGANGV